MTRADSRPHLLAAAGLLAALMLVTACGTPTPTDDGSNGDPGGEVKTYTYLTFGGIDTLDPVGAYDTASGTALENVYETLYGFDGPSVDTFAPRLATAHQVSADGRTYTFDLREDVAFHSGNALTCRDVEYSFERALVMNPPGSGVWFLAESLLGTNLNADDDPSVTWSAIDAAVECLDDATVRFELAASDPSFLGKLTYTSASVIDSEWAIAAGEWSGGEDDWRAWVGANPRDGHLHDDVSGTGAYGLVSWNGGDSSYERHDAYWGETPDVERVEYRIVDDLDARIDALSNGTADRIVLGSGSDWLTLENRIRGQSGVTIWEDDGWRSTSVSAVHFDRDVVTAGNEANVGSGALDGDGIPADFFTDLDVRKGFAYAFDRQGLIDDLYLGNGEAVTMALPPSFAGYDPTIDTYAYDLALAEDHFRAAFGGDVGDQGFRLSISYNTGNLARRAVAESLATTVGAIDPAFQIDVRDLSWPDYLSARNAGELPLSIQGWLPDYPDPDPILWTYYHSSGFYASDANFEDAQIDTWLEQARATIDPAERADLYSQVGQRAHDLAAALLLPTSRTFIVTTDEIQGVTYNPMLSHGYSWKDVVKGAE